MNIAVEYSVNAPANHARARHARVYCSGRLRFPYCATAAPDHRSRSAARGQSIAVALPSRTLGVGRVFPRAPPLGVQPEGNDVVETMRSKRRLW